MGRTSLLPYPTYLKWTDHLFPSISQLIPATEPILVDRSNWTLARSKWNAWSLCSDGPLRLAAPPLGNVDDICGHRRGTIASISSWQWLGNFSETVRQFSMETEFRRPIDLAPMSSDSQCILVHCIWWVFSLFGRPPNGIRTLVRLTLCCNCLPYRILLLCRTACWFDWKSQPLQRGDGKISVKVVDWKGRSG